MSLYKMRRSLTECNNVVQEVWKTIIHLGSHVPVLRSNTSYLSDPAPLEPISIYLAAHLHPEWVNWISYIMT